MKTRPKIFTYFYFHQNTLRVDVGYATEKFENFLDKSKYNIMRKIEGAKPIIGFSCHAINEDGIPYAVNIPAIDADHAEEMFKSLYPNDNLIEAKEIVYDEKPMIY